MTALFLFYRVFFALAEVRKIYTLGCFILDHFFNFAVAMMYGEEMKYPIMILGITGLLMSGFSLAQQPLLGVSCEDFKQQVERHAHILLSKKQNTLFNNTSLSVKPKQTEIISYALVVGYNMNAKRAGFAANNLCNRHRLGSQPN